MFILRLLPTPPPFFFVLFLFLFLLLLAFRGPARGELVQATAVCGRCCAEKEASRDGGGCFADLELRTLAVGGADPAPCRSRSRLLARQMTKLGSDSPD